jgi:hypothetical protein
MPLLVRFLAPRTRTSTNASAGIGGQSTFPPHEPTIHDDERSVTVWGSLVVILPSWMAAVSLVVLIGVADLAVAQASEAAFASDAPVQGVVTLNDAEGGAFAAAGADVVLTCPSVPPRVTVADAAGVFRFDGVRPSGCKISIDLQGLHTLTTAVDNAGAAVLRFTLESKPLVAGITVRAPAAPPKCRGSKTSIHRRPPVPSTPRNTESKCGRVVR